MFPLLSVQVRNIYGPRLAPRAFIWSPMATMYYTGTAVRPYLPLLLDEVRCVF